MKLTVYFLHSPVTSSLLSTDNLRHFFFSDTPVGIQTYTSSLLLVTKRCQQPYFYTETMDVFHLPRTSVM